ncbi:MAG: hypothetical protein ABJK37_10440 [Paraglaciecola sp.]|uniref:hypothetical protein n=1 Tax=Paraglaciecola sp. TaxID=1920173 RepID=UPI00329741DD
MKNFYLLAILLSVTQVFLPINMVQATPDTKVERHVVEAIKKANQAWQRHLVQGEIAKVLKNYGDKAIFMPEYQPTLNGINDINEYLTTLNSRRTLHKVSYQSEEMLKLGHYVLEIGRFEKEIEWLNVQPDKHTHYTGKYWRIWNTEIPEDLKIIGEAFGFYQHLKHPEFWVTNRKTRSGTSPNHFKASNASIELQAYHALGRIGVKQKDGELRAKMYTQDAIFYPFAAPPKKGMAELTPYLIQYSSHGATIESVQTYTHDVIYFDNFILEFAKFAVAWTYEGLPGSANGKGISLRKRLENGELRFFRHIGMHNYDGY